MGVLVVLGIVLRAAAYLANRSLFIDEAALALSIRDRGFTELLTRPLDYGQTAPPGFLVLLEAATVAFGESEYSLRLPALIAGSLSLPLFALLARRLLPPTGVLLAVSLFAFGRPLVYFSGEAKPYALDVLGAVVILLLASSLSSGLVSRGRAAALGLAGAVLVWFSQPLLFIMAGVGVVLLATLSHDRRAVRMLVPLAALPWLVSGALSVWYAFASYPKDARSYMRAYWDAGFLPARPDSVQEWLWLPRALLTFCLDPLGSPLPLLPLAFLLAGAFVLGRRDLSALGLAAGPFLVILLASAAKVYPFGRMDFHPEMFSGRVVLFLMPPALLLIGSGFGQWWDRSAGPARLVLYVAALVTVGSSAALTFASFPFGRENARAAFQYLARNRAPGEPVYVYFRAQHYARFYAPQFGLDPQLFRFGSCLPGAATAYLEELDGVRAAGRTWFVVIPSDTQEPRMTREFLRRNGVELDRFEGKGAWVSLFQMRVQGRAVLPPDSMLVSHTDPVVKRLACATIYRPPAR